MTRRLLLGYLGITLFVVLSLEVPLGIQNQRTERRDLAVKVEHDAVVFASLAEDAIQSGSSSQLRPIADRAYAYTSSRGGARVVIVDAAGNARIDTSARVSGSESFATRPEIAAALRGTVASGTRYSRTLRESLVYVAVPIASGGRVHGAVRITYPTSAVDARILRYWLILGLIAGVVLAVAAGVGLLTARFVTRPLRRLETAAASVGRGDLDARAPEHDGPAEVRSLAAVFNETVSKLAQLLRAQEEFVADASHELRTPLTALQLRLESLEQEVARDGRRDLDAALGEVERLSEMVEGLLALARADAAPAATVDAAAIARERVEIWRPFAQERGIDLRAEGSTERPARAAPQRVAQIVDNFVSNALDAAPDGSTVTVFASDAGEAIELRVRDEGPGLRPEQRARAFDRFWRAGNGHPGSGLSGSGLGLAIVRKLADADAATVALEEAPGGGLDAVVRLRRA
ncbi:MAG TPA: ATP-binding protein [Gaiellaceae bacterium]|nr:ATP-binding protein [Gaiellaceae bacterium]